MSQTKATDCQRPVIYQMLPRLFTNYTAAPIPNGTIHTNGSGKLNDINPSILSSIKKMGVTHVWYTGVIEHGHDADYTAFGIRRNNPYIIKGRAGSPYAITDYYDIDPDLAVNVPERMTEFENLVKRTHDAGLKVITDFVPNHTAREYHSDSCPPGVKDFGTDDDRDMFFRRDNNYYYIPRQQFSPSIFLGDGKDTYIEFPAKATGNDCFSAFPTKNDWYETVKLNYGYDPGNGSRNFDPIPDTWFKMLHIMRFWASKGIDGIRCDMVHMVPVEFWQWAIPQIKQHYPDMIFIAEIYDIGLYRPYIEQGCFDYLYDKVGLYDTLRGIQCHNISAARLTSCWQSVDGISSHMLNFLENHDEQRYASPQFAGRADTVTPLLTACCTMGTGAMMVYMGQEIGEDAPDAEGYSGHDGRTTIFDYWSIEKLRRWLNNGKPSVRNLNEDEKNLRALYTKLLTAVNKYPALRCGSFFDLMYVNYDNPMFNPHRQYAYLRSTGTQTALIALNFDSAPVSIDINIPAHAFDTLDIMPFEGNATELLSGEKIPLVINSETPASVSIDAHSAVIIIAKTSLRTT